MAEADKNETGELALRIVDWDDFECNTRNRQYEKGQARRKRGLDYVRDTVTGEAFGMMEQKLFKVAGAEGSCRADGLYRKLRRITGDMDRDFRGWLVRRNGEVIDAVLLAEITWYSVNSVLEDVGYLIAAGWVELAVCPVAVNHGQKIFTEIPSVVMTVPEIPEVGKILKNRKVPEPYINNQLTNSSIMNQYTEVGCDTEEEIGETGGSNRACSEKTGAVTKRTGTGTAGASTIRGRKATISQASQTNDLNDVCEKDGMHDLFGDWSEGWLERVRIDKAEVDEKHADVLESKRIYLPETASPDEMLDGLAGDEQRDRIALEQRVMVWCHSMIGDLLTPSRSASDDDRCQVEQNVRALKDGFYRVWENGGMGEMIWAVRLLQEKYRDRNHLVVKKQTRNVMAAWLSGVKGRLGVEKVNDNV